MKRRTAWFGTDRGSESPPPGIHGLSSPNPRRASGFFERVYAVVKRIPRGRVATYGQVAALLGNPRAARTVGWALRALPAGSRVPWHRVVNGSGGISANGRRREAALQAQRLQRESVTIGREGRIPLERFCWRPRAPVR